jgi:hypothetical protein
MTNENVTELQSHNHRLQELHTWFRGFVAAKMIRTRTYFETLSLRPGIPLLKKLVGSVIVNETSSDTGDPSDLATPLPEDHLSICKPSSREAQLYLGVKQFISDLCPYPSASICQENQSHVQRKSIFISYRHIEPDRQLANIISSHLLQAGHDTFLDTSSIRWGADWVKTIEGALSAADYMVLLLSQESARSEMVVEEIRIAKKLSAANEGRKPKLLPIRVHLPFDESLPYHISAWIQSLQQVSWENPSDTPRYCICWMKSSRVRASLELFPKRSDMWGSVISDLKLPLTFAPSVHLVAQSLMIPQIT